MPYQRAPQAPSSRYGRTRPSPMLRDLEAAIPVGPVVPRQLSNDHAAHESDAARPMGDPGTSLDQTAREAGRPADPAGGRGEESSDLEPATDTSEVEQDIEESAGNAIGVDAGDEGAEEKGEGGLAEENAAAGSEEGAGPEGGVPLDGGSQARSVADRPSSGGGASDGGGQRGGTDEVLTPPSPPAYVAPDLNAIRSPILRPPPVKSVAQTPKILKDTGSTPVQHHANIQTVLFRVSETARQAQRDMVQAVESIAVDARFDIEAMAAQIDGIIAQSCRIVAAAAQAAYTEIETLAEARIDDIRRNTAAGQGDMAQKEADVRAAVVRTLNENGSGEIREANAELRAAYEEYAPEAQRQLPLIANGQPPPFVAFGGNQPEPPEGLYQPEDGEVTTFAARGEKIVVELFTAPSGTPSGQYYAAFKDRAQARAVPYLATEHHDNWVRAAEERAELYNSESNRNRFVMSSLGLIAPTAEAMDVDEEEFQETLSKNVHEQYDRMSRAQERAISGIETTLRGPNSVKAFFDAANPKSLPGRVIKGLRKAGRKMKRAMMDQGRLIQASHRSSIAGMAEAYPDVVTRLNEMLIGDDLLDERTMLPRVEAAGTTLVNLRDGHIDATKSQADGAVKQAREGFDRQIGGIWETVDKALGDLTENKLKANFHFELTYAFYTGYDGEFSADLEAALRAVTGYAATAAERLIRPVALAEEKGTLIQRRAIAYFNGQLAREWEGYIKNAVNKLDEAIGYGQDTDSDDEKPLPKIALDKDKELDVRKDEISVALHYPDPMRVIVGSTVGALTPPPANLVGFGVAAQEIYSSIPDKDGAATALAMPWPGPLALDYRMATTSSEPPAKQRVRELIPDWDADKSRLLGLFGTSEGEAAESKRQLIAGADRLWGVNDDAVEALARSFSPSELETFDEAEIQEMSEAVRANLWGAQLEITQAYIDGRPARAAAIRIREEMARARRDGDEEMAEFGQSMDRELMAELQRSSGAYVPKEQLRQLSDRMFVELATLIPPQPGPGRSVDIDALAVSAESAAGPVSMANADGDELAMSVDPTAPPPLDLVQRLHDTGRIDDRSRAPSDPLADEQEASPDAAMTPGEDPVAAQAFEQSVIDRAAERPDPNTVAAARRQFLDFATRDYVQSQTWGPLSPFIEGGGDDRLSQWTMAGRSVDALPLDFRVSETRTIRGGLIVDRMSPSTVDMLTAYVTHGSSSPEYRQARAVQALTHAEGRVFGTSEQDVIALSQTFGSPRLSRARARLVDAERRNDEADDALSRQHRDAEIADAQEEVDAARKEHDRFLVQVAGQLNGQSMPENPTEAEIASAHELISRRINAVAGDFDDNLETMGADLATGGSIDLVAGMRAATEGWGTYDALLSEVTSNRRRSEFAAYFEPGGQGEEDGITRASLGVGENADWFSETSGDQAQQLEIAFWGRPENSAEEMEIAALKARHQLQDGTGLIASMTMLGSPQKRDLIEARDALGARLHASIAANDDPHNPVPAEILALSPSELIRPDGSLHPQAGRLAVDRHGHFFGPGPTSSELTANVETAARNYAAEIGRQEAFFTGLITTAAVVVSIVLLIVPGVNVAAAGILTALLAGAATIAVKAGMRGDRYGWEEAAADLARTGVEAATAGVGGALGGAVKPGAGALGKIATVGEKINNAFGTRTLGKMGSAAFREGLTSSASGVANQALDDRIWSKGIDEGIGTLFMAGARGAATGAVSGGVSEGIAGGVKHAFGTSRLGGLDGKGLTAIGNRLSSGGREIVEEAMSNMGGTALSELAGFLVDIAEDKPGAEFDQFLKNLGPALLKDLVTSTGRTAVKGHMRNRLEAERARIMSKDGEISLADATMLRRLAISAGEETYGRGTIEDNLGRGLAADASPVERYRHDLNRARSVLSTIPPELASHMRGLSPNDILAIGRIRADRSAADTETIERLVSSLYSNYAGVDASLMLQTLRAVIRRDARVAERDAGTRKRMLRHLPRTVRSALEGAPVDAISSLPRVLQDEAAHLLTAGDDDPAALEAFVARARDRDESIDAEQLTSQLQGLMAGRAEAEDGVEKTRARQVRELGEVLPSTLRDVAEGLPPKDAAFLYRTAFSEEGLPPIHEIDGLVTMLAKRAPHLDSETLGAQIGAMLTSGAKEVAARKAKAAEAAAAERARRADQLDNVPEDLRPLMAHLPDDALLEIRKAQSLGPPMDEGRLGELVARARRAEPDLDGEALASAMRATMRRPLAARPFFERFRQRRTLVTFVPKTLRGLVRRTPILNVPDGVFASYVRSQEIQGDRPRQNAVTIRLNDEIVILVREGADSFALREEGRHVVQMHDPAWAARLAELGEETLNDWHSLPVEHQMRLARTVVDAEIDAHETMITMLQHQAITGFLSGTRARAAARLDMLERRLAVLQRRQTELSGITPAMELGIAMGLLPRPAVLDQPARLFNEDTELDTWLVKSRLLQEASSETADADPRTLTEKLSGIVKTVYTYEKWAKDTVAALNTLASDIDSLDPEVAYGLKRVFKKAADKGHSEDDDKETRGGKNTKARKRVQTLIAALVEAKFLEVIDRSRADVDGYTREHQRMIAVLLRQMGNDLALGRVAYTRQRDWEVQFEAYEEAIKAIRKETHPDRVAETYRAIAKFVMKAETNRSADDELATPKPHELRGKLLDFLVGVSLGDDISGLAAQHLTTAHPFALNAKEPKKAEDLPNDGLKFQDLAGKLKTQWTSDVDQMNESDFVEALTGKPLSPDEVPDLEMEQAKKLYPLYKIIVNTLDFSPRPNSEESKGPGDVAVALYYAHRLLTDPELPDDRRLSIKAIKRVLRAPGFADFRSKDEQSAPQERLPPNILDALPLLHQLLAAKDSKDGEPSSQTRMLYAALKSRSPLMAEGTLRRYGDEGEEISSTFQPEKLKGELAARLYTALIAATAPTSEGLKPPVEKTTAGGLLDLYRENQQASEPSTDARNQPSDDARKRPARIVTVDLAEAPERLAPTLRNIAEEAGVLPEGKTKVLLRLLASLPQGEDAKAEILPGDGFLFVLLRKRTSSKEDATLTGFIGQWLRVTNDDVIDVGASKVSYVDLVKTFSKMTKEGGDVNFFSAMVELFQGRKPSDVPNALYKELALAINLMFGIEVVRHPPALATAILSVFVGKSLRPVAEGLHPRHLVFGDPRYRDVMDIFKENPSEKDLGFFEQDRENRLMANLMKAEYNRIFLESGGLFANSMVDFMKYDQHVATYLDGTLTDPARIKWAEAILSRSARLVELALPVFFSDRGQLGIDDVKMLTRISAGNLEDDPEVLKDLMHRVLEEMLRRMRSEQSNVS